MKPLLALLITILLSVIAFHAYAAKETVMYKKIDEDGNVVFTDKPIPGSKAIKVKTETNVVETPKPSFRPQITQEKKPEGKDNFKYDVLAIDMPKNDEAVRANAGNINVVVAITPNLQTRHSVQLKLDGQNKGQQQSVPYFTMTEVARGTHQLQAVIVDKETGEEIQSSEAISFHTLRASRLNNKRRNKR